MGSGSWLRLKQRLTFNKFRVIESGLESFQCEYDRYPKTFQELSTWKTKAAKHHPVAPSEKQTDNTKTKTAEDKTGKTAKTPPPSTVTDSESDKIENPVLKAKIDDLKQGLAEEEKVDHQFLDAWSNPIQYESDATSWRLISHGMDGLPGGIGLAGDLVWTSESRSDDVGEYLENVDKFYNSAVPTFSEVVRSPHLQAGVTFWALFGFVVGTWACLKKDDKPPPKSRKEWIITILAGIASLVIMVLLISFLIFAQSVASGH